MSDRSIPVIRIAQLVFLIGFFSLTGYVSGYAAVTSEQILDLEDGYRLDQLRTIWMQLQQDTVSTQRLYCEGIFEQNAAKAYQTYSRLYQMDSLGLDNNFLFFNYPGGQIDQFHFGFSDSLLNNYRNHGWEDFEKLMEDHQKRMDEFFKKFQYPAETDPFKEEDLPQGEKI